MISYKEACDVVFSAQKFGISLGLDRMELMLEELGNPERQIPAIHLAGTNGKGSTLTYLAAIFTEAGYSVGTYTSPAINKLNDKIKVNGEEISDEDFANIIEEFQPVIENVSKTSFGPPTEFEILTAVAFKYFAVKKPDIVFIETGLGGRLDSTNVVFPLVSIITTIGHDHMDLLGNTIAKVAAEKAGIIKEGVPVVSGCKQEEAVEVMRNRSQQLSSSLYQLDEDFQCIHQGDHFAFKWEDMYLEDLKTGMIGKHQQENATLAMMAIQALKQEFSISEHAIRRGVANAKIANRIEIVHEHPTIIFDGGHNLEGMEALSQTLSSNFQGKNIYILFCAMKDKDITAMLKPLIDLATEIILTKFDFERVMDPYQVYSNLPLQNMKVVENSLEAYDQIKQKLHSNDVLVVTGSLYFLNHVRSEVVNNFL
ncbi:bifunctional folylpolyglutamate synthase/dihydrofolate synthase [Anaerobacillus alkaliphilus]|nr:folylpolyglutamate synthase/dihydrofolate synthase family protein [Anaerobacillus alkaliphilus]